MELTKLPIFGCYEIMPAKLQDRRGFFVKTFRSDIFSSSGLATAFVEEYYSYSQKNVLRGLHFQIPPFDHVKVVYCVSGEVMDAVVDLRIGSPTYGRSHTIILNADKANMLYIPSGLAHGFYVTSSGAVVMYKVTSAYSPQHDMGIRWDSAGIPWPGRAPLLSDRDSGFPALSDYESPFRWEPQQ